MGQLEEVTTSGTTTTTTNYYAAGGKPIALAVNGVLSYLVKNGLGSVTEALTTSGTVQASQLYAPYGGMRYSSGTMSTSYGFTGQRQEVVTGLDYYIARYYDPVAGQFTSPDTILPGDGYEPWGLSRYAYVGGNPIGRTDPTGHFGWGDVGNFFAAAADFVFDYSGLIQNFQDANDLNKTPGQRTWAFIQFEVGVTLDLFLVKDLAVAGGKLLLKGLGKGLSKLGIHLLEDEGKTAAKLAGDEGKTLAKGADDGAGTSGGGQSGADAGNTITPDNHPPRPPYNGHPRPGGRPPTSINPETGKPRTIPDFGKNVIKWGQHSEVAGTHGSEIARLRIQTITRSELEANGVTLDIAEWWYLEYDWQAAHNPPAEGPGFHPGGNQTAPGRADLMWYIYLLLGGDPAGP